ncbi:MerR family transcriptional regulator [Planomonospora parontospora]|uniref:MerR family transcriptional regulator n=1 Tax=Planomonospora parontospora TaxID=58119 RepID=UPI00166F99DA|nr:MerR family transcriptional regulator [Planomonospora parontospora]GGL21888.1 MerR family transcriptional regulator [Planomonospora parontospora subsp. antibiotica]GII15735.1 MerR family transcriptional regulator [Planomonospora parontospora subsp. antibiotica]
MRIGELAALAGVSTRTVRHYHRLGLLPEPERRANGYRVYGLRAAVTLARIRRLTELGLSLAEVGDALADDRGRDLREILTELDADLARQEQEIRLRRARLAELLTRDSLHPDDPVSPGMTGLLSRLPQAETGMLARERELLALLDATAGPDTHRLLLETAPDAGHMGRVEDLYRELDALADADPGDPRVPGLAERLADAVPPDMLRSGLLDPALRPADADGGADGEAPAGEREAFARAFLADLPPAQAEVVRQVMALLADRSAT